MKTEDIKVGETYNVRMFVSHYSKGIISCCTVIGYDEVDGIQCGEEYDICHDEIAAFSPITPENGRKNSEPAPKYDPCRLFKKGDAVRVVEWNGRNYYDIDHNTKLETGCLAEIAYDEEAEQQEGYVSVIFQEYIRYVPPCFLELVTPVEELEPYIVSNDDIEYCVFDQTLKKTVCRYDIWHPNAEAAAEAECERLNAVYRKEQSNG